MSEKYIYVVLIQAHTGLGKIGRKITNYKYTHVAICLDESLTDFISFSRRKHYNPFNAGFMHEKRCHYAFGKYRDFGCKVFRVPVLEKNYRKILRFIQKCEQDKEYLFNLYSMLTMPFLHGLPIYKAYNCMSFTGRILKLSGSIPMDRPYYRYSILQMDELLQPYFYMEGRLEKAEEDCAYMEKREGRKLLYDGMALNGKLIKRMFQKRGRSL